jgi:hypothetical protein
MVVWKSSSVFGFDNLAPDSGEKSSPLVFPFTYYNKRVFLNEDAEEAPTSFSSLVKCLQVRPRTPESSSSQVASRPSSLVYLYISDVGKASVCPWPVLGRFGYSLWVKQVAYLKKGAITYSIRVISSFTNVSLADWLNVISGHDEEKLLTMSIAADDIKVCHRQD